MAAGDHEDGLSFADALDLTGQAVAFGAQGQLEEPLQVISGYGDADEDPSLGGIVKLARAAQQEPLDARVDKPE